MRSARFTRLVEEMKRKEVGESGQLSNLIKMIRGCHKKKERMALIH